MNRYENFWNKKAEGYAKSPISDEASYQHKLTETQQFLSLNMQLIEFGCGTGTTAIHHAPYVQHIDAIDISENMLTIARDRANEAGVNNISFSHGSLEDFKADSGSADAVLGLNVIHLIRDRKALVEEVARVLKPGGVFVSSTVCLGNSAWRWIKLILPLGKALGLMPDLLIIEETGLVKEIMAEGFSIETHWSHGKGDISVFIIARKIG